MNRLPQLRRTNRKVQVAKSELSDEFIEKVISETNDSSINNVLALKAQGHLTPTEEMAILNELLQGTPTLYEENGIVTIAIPELRIEFV